jgi:hypothetical protein
MAKRTNLDYPFNSQQIAESANNTIERLAIELGSSHPGNSDQHFDRVATIFWNKCLHLPIEPFEAEWRE